jgi:fucose 4-O-acetylase-like acetyltransferase
MDGDLPDALPPVSASPTTPPAGRNEFVDYLKGWLILLVVWGHAIQYLAYQDAQFWSDPIFRLIYIFHMPLFMAVSGYVGFGAIQRLAVPAYASRRIRQVLAPILGWAIVFRLLLALPGWLLAGAPAPAAWFIKLGHDLQFESWLRFWFLWAVFLAAMITAVLRAARLDRWPAFLFVTIASLFLPDEANLGLIKSVLPFYFLGHLFARGPLIPSASLQPKLLGVGLAATLAAWLAWKPQYHAYLVSLRLTSANAGFLAVRFATVAVVSATFVLLAWRVYRPGRGAILIGLGRASLGIYILQTFVFYGVRWLGAPFDARLLALVLGLPAALVICLGLGQLVAILEGYPLVARWLLGRVESRPR